MIWDGDGAGSGAQSWESCDKAPNCEVKVGADPGSGVNGSTSLKMHGKGPGFIGLGWNIFGWYPENAGVDLTPYSHLTFQIRIDAKTPADAPDPGSVGVLLGCSKVKKDSATLPVERYAKGFADGKWHKVSMPISAFVKGPGAQFDLGVVLGVQGRHVERLAPELRPLHRRNRRRKAVTPWVSASRPRPRPRRVSEDSSLPWPPGWAAPRPASIPDRAAAARGGPSNR